MKAIHFALLMVLLLTGCTTWHVEDDKETSLFRPNSLAPDAVVLEVAIVSTSMGQKELEDELWSRLDDSAFELEDRRKLREVGFRCGIASSQLPPVLDDLIDEKRDEIDLNTSEKIFSASETGGLQHLQCRSGSAQPISLSKVYPTLSWITEDDGYRKGESREDAECFFTMRAYPQGDGGALVTLVPEIHHGDQKSQFHATFNSWATKVGREKVYFDASKISANLSLGQTLVVTCTPKKVGIGAYFFTDKDSDSDLTRILLIRLAQSQRDDLFAPDQILAPIVTPTD